ncbi:MAG TPA: glycosyltransferase family 39 protein [Terriglobales bacterium]|nr:glycosyltransferase family 39 protein [Terriglobales bacterium]
MASQLIRAATPSAPAERAHIVPVQVRSPILLLASTVAVALVLRIFWILYLKTYQISTFPDDHFYFGYETGRIARAIASGQGFSNPFHGETGPTAWLAPVYPYLAAAIFKLFGIYTAQSAFVLLAINGLLSALTCMPLFFAARRVFGTRVAWWSTWAWAILAPLSYWSVHWVWETSLSTFLFTCIFLVTLNLADAPRFRRWMLFGALWGVVALTNPSLLSLLPFFGIWACWRSHRHSRPWFLQTSASAIIFFAVISPWIVRNYQVFERLVFIRDNFGVEVRLGNGPGAEGVWMEWLHPTQNARELQRYRSMGELAYSQTRGEEAMSFILNSPSDFARLCAKRFVYFWAGLPRNVNWKSGAERWKNIASIVEFRNSGYLTLSVLAFWGLFLAIRRGDTFAFLFAAVLVIYPLVYYAVFPHPRYRHPIEPEMVMLAAYLVSQTSTFRRRGTLLPIAPPQADEPHPAQGVLHLVRNK